MYTYSPEMHNDDYFEHNGTLTFVHETFRGTWIPVQALLMVVSITLGSHFENFMGETLERVFHL